MADTPRVTVPVEPEYTATDYLRLIAEGWEVIESTGSQMTIQNPEDDGPQDLVIDIDAMLSAAPAPKGGAVDYGVRAEGAPGIAEPDPALATREESPANTPEQLAGRLIGEVVAEEAARNKLIVLIEQWDGESEYDAEDVAALADDILDAFNGPPVISEGEVTADGLRSVPDDEVLALLSSRNVGSARAHLARTINALRAQPPAREDAQPVWIDGVPTKHHAKEWFIAETTFGDRAVLTALPEEYAYDFKTADETYIKADRIRRWMPFPDSQYLFPNPAPDALRVAVEALLPIARSNTRLGQAGAKLRLALDAVEAALQAEQKGGA